MLVIDTPAGPADLPRLCARLRALLEASGAEVAACDARALPGTFDSVEVLMRLRLCALRSGRRFRVVRASTRLALMLAFCGLSDVLGLGF